MLGHEQTRGRSASSTGAAPGARSREVSQRYGLHGRPGRAGRGPAGRRPAAGRDHQGADPRRRGADPRRADRGAHPAGDRRADRASCARCATRAPRSSSSPTSCARSRPIADRITVIRRGKVVGTADARPPRGRAGRADGRPAGAADGRQGAGRARRGGARGRRRSRSIDDRGARASSTTSRFAVRAGEISRIAGVQGNGQTELVEALVGPAHARRRAGSRSTARTSADARASTRSCDRGVGYIPEDRAARRAGRQLHRRREPGPRHLRPAAVRRAAWRSTWTRSRRTPTQRVEEFDIRTAVASRRRRRRCPAATSRRSSWPASCRGRCELLVAAQPTRGLDVGSIEFIHRRIVAERDSGAAVLLVSTELDEVLGLADRIAVMYRGRIVGERARRHSRARRSAC